MITGEQLTQLKQIATDADQGYFATTADEETAAELLPALLAEYEATKIQLAEAQQRIEQLIDAADKREQDLKWESMGDDL